MYLAGRDEAPAVERRGEAFEINTQSLVEHSEAVFVQCRLRAPTHTRAFPTHESARFRAKLIIANEKRFLKSDITWYPCPPSASYRARTDQTAAWNWSLLALLLECLRWM